VQLDTQDLQEILDFVEGLNAIVSASTIGFERTTIYIEGEPVGYVDMLDGKVVFCQES
jgi:hypothetical protein